MIIKEITWAIAHDYWKAELWQNVAEIRMRASVHPTGVNDTNIQTFEVKFWGAYDGEQLVGVISGFMTSATDYRVRGLDVKKGAPAGARRVLLATAEQEGRTWGCTRVWDIASPEHATPMIENLGFVLVGDFVGHKNAAGEQLVVVAKALV